MEQDKKDAANSRGERKAFKAALAEKRKEFRQKIKAERKAKTPSRDRQKFKDPLPRVERLRIPTNVIPGDLQTTAVESMAPPGCRVYHDTWNGRWSMSMGKLLRSRSWLKYGHGESAIVLLKKMWDKYQEQYGLEVCPVKGLPELAASFEEQCGSCHVGAAPHPPTLGSVSGSWFPLQLIAWEDPGQRETTQHKHNTKQHKHFNKGH